MKKTYYEVIELIDGADRGILCENKNFKSEGVRWSEFTNYEDAKKAMLDSINFRKSQYTYCRDNNGVLVEKVSYYEQHDIVYKIRKIVREVEVMDVVESKKTKTISDDLTQEISI